MTKNSLFGHIKLLCCLSLVSLLIVTVVSEQLTQKHLIEILQQSNKSPFVNLLFIYDTATQTGKQLHQFVPLITDPKKDYYKVHLVDCNTQDKQVQKTFPFCSKDHRQKLPALMYTEPSLNVYSPETGALNQAKQHQYQGPLDEKSLFQFALPLLRAFSVNLKKIRDLSSFIQTNKQVPRITYFTDKEKLPTIYKVLTAHFRNTIAFAHVMKDSPIANYLNISKYPTILLNEKQQIPLSKNLEQMIKRLSDVQGEQTNIVISEFQEGLQEITSENIQKLVYELPQHTLIHVNDPSGQIHPEWKKCQQNFRKMFHYYETSTMAKQLGVKQTPSIVYFPKSLAKKSVQKSVFYPKDTFRTIYDQIASLIEDFTVPLANDMQMQKLTSLPLQEGKIIAVLFHQQQISLSYRVLSNDPNYKKDIVFFRMKDPQQAVMQKFQIKKIPALYVMINDKEKQQSQKNKKGQEELPEGRMMMNLQIAQYNGKFNYDDLTRYFGMFIQKPKQSEQTISEQTKSFNLIQLDNSKKFKKHCVEENCYILLVDGRQSKNQNNQKYKNEIKKFASRVHENFAVLDASCHSQISGALQIQHEELPILIYLNPKFEKYSRLVGTIGQKSINSFISRIQTNKASYRGYDKLNFDNKKDCLLEHSKLDQYEKGSSTQSTLNEAQLQILKQIQLQEENKKKQMQRIQKQLQKNEKKKRRRRRAKNQEQSDLQDL